MHSGLLVGYDPERDKSVGHLMVIDLTDGMKLKSKLNKQQVADCLNEMEATPAFTRGKQPTCPDAT